MKQQKIERFSSVSIAAILVWKLSFTDYSLKPIDPVMLLFHVFGYDIVNNGFEKEIKLEFESKNENVDCTRWFLKEIVAFADGFDWDV